MSHKKKLIPFNFLPASWGLRGKTYRIAEAEYNLHGEDLERRLAEIDADDDADRLSELLLVLDVKYKKKTEFDADCVRAKIDRDQESSDRTPEDEIKLIELKIKHHVGEPYTCHKRLAELKNANEEDRKLALLAVERAYDKLDDHEFEKQSATVRNEPWIGVVDHGYNPSDGVNGLYIEFDWNDQWISYLRANGYVGFDEDAIVEKWFQDLNRTIAEPEDGYNFIQNSPRGNRFDRGDGLADYM